MPTKRNDSIALAVGPITAILFAGLSSGVRSQVGSTNVALVLTFIVVVAAMAGRAPGVVTALASALGYNFFHTLPLRSLRINSGKDVITVILLVAIGLLIGEIGTWRRRLQSSSVRHFEGQQMLETSAALLAQDRPLAEVWSTIRGLLVKELRLADCRFELGAANAAPTLKRSGSMNAADVPEMRLANDGFELPAGGMSVPVTFAGKTVGHIVLIAKPGSGSRLDERRVAVALADHLAVAIDKAGAGSAAAIATTTPATPANL